jgi:hypothetical protein
MSASCAWPGANDHARENEGFGDLQASPARLAGMRFGQRVIGDQHQIAAQHLSGLALQAMAHAVGKKANHGHGGYGDDQRGKEQAQFAGAHFPAEQAPGEC